MGNIDSQGECSSAEADSVESSAQTCGRCHKGNAKRSKACKAGNAARLESSVVNKGRANCKQGPLIGSMEVPCETGSFCHELQHKKIRKGPMCLLRITNAQKTHGTFPDGACHMTLVSADDG